MAKRWTAAKKGTVMSWEQEREFQRARAQKVKVAEVSGVSPVKPAVKKKGKG